MALKKKYLLLVIFPLLAFLLSSCKESMEKNVVTKNPQQSGDKEKSNLRVAIYNGDNYMMKEIIQKFPLPQDSSIDIIEYFYGYDEEQYRMELNTSLMSGNAVDLFILYGDIYHKLGFSQTDYFMDIYPLIDDDPSVKREDYYENILKAFEANGKLIGFPVMFNLISVGVNTNYTKALAQSFGAQDAVGFDHLLQYYGALNPSEDIYFEPATNVLKFTKMYGGIDYENQIVNIDNPAFIEKLALIKEATYPSSEFDPLWWQINDTGLDVGGKYLYRLTALGHEELLPNESIFKPVYANGTIGGPKGIFTDFKPLVTQNGEAYLYMDGGAFAINALTEYKSLAWELLKFLTSGEAQYFEKMYTIRHTVNREQNEKNINKFFMDLAEDVNHDNTITEQQQEGIDAAVQKILAHLEMPVYLYTDGDSWGIKDILYQYQTGLLTAAETAAQIQSKAMIYMAEQQ